VCSEDVHRADLHVHLCEQVLDSPQYEVFIMSIIIFNTLMMATEFDPPDRIFNMISEAIGMVGLDNNK
jgi:hypothetical protein